jgi:glycosyltransferase involved in cell wall biosynthesis
VTAPPLTVLLLDAHLRGGGQVRYIANLAAQLKRLGQRPIMGCRPGSLLERHAADAGIPCVNTFALRGGARPAGWWHDVRLLAGRVRDEQIDVVHVSGSQDHWTAGFLRGARPGAFCLVRTRHNTNRVKRSLPNRWLNRRATDYQIAVCESVRTELAGHPAFHADRLTAIHNGVDASTYRPDPDARADARAEFGYGPGDVVCGIAARLVEAKGHRYLFEAVASLCEMHPALRILVLGEGPLEADLRAMAERLGIAGAVRFAGFRDDMPRCVRAFDIGVQPSIAVDTSSFSLKEQMAAGIPVIASDYGGLPEIVRDGVEGRVVPAGTVMPLAQALDDLATDAALRERRGEAGRARVLEEFTVERFGERTLAAYHQALELRRGG